MSNDAAKARALYATTLPMVQRTVEAIRGRRRREMPGMVPTHPPTFEEIAEIATAAAVAAVIAAQIEDETASCERGDGR